VYFLYASGENKRITKLTEKNKPLLIFVSAKPMSISYFSKQKRLTLFAGVNIIPKKADFLDPKIIFCPQF